MGACLTQDQWKEFLEQSPFDSIDCNLSSHLESCSDCNEILERLCDSDDLRTFSQNPSTTEISAVRNDWEFMRTQLIAAGKSRTAEFEHEEPVFIDVPIRESLGRFRLIRQLGEGAHGVVYLAEDTVIGRRVALKLPRHTGLTNPNRRNSFLREAQAAGLLQHPNIVSVFEAGEIDGVCYMAAAYSSAMTLEEWLNGQSRPISPRTIAQIVAVLADAVEHAHQSNIIHRDLKPTNILIDFKFPSADLPFRPQITDFGLAKIIDMEEQQQTATGVIKGTVAYMSPEQVQQRPVGPHTDLFALGTILYQMLTNELPFQGDYLSETLRKVIEKPPIPPRRIDPKIPRDLQAICLKCLEKRPENRYASASDLQDDLNRFCNGEAITARATSSIILACRWAKRRPSLAAMLITMVLALCFGVLGLSLHVRKLAELNQNLQVVTGDLKNALADASAAQDRAETSEQSAREFAMQSQQMSYASDMKLAARSWRDGEVRQVRNLLDRHHPTDMQRDLRGLEWFYLDHAISLPTRHTLQLDASIYWIARSPNNDQIAVASSDGMIRLISSETFLVEDMIETGQGEVNSVVYSLDGKLLASAGDDGTVKIFDATTGKPKKSIPAHAKQAFGLAFTPDGKSLISCGADSKISRWNTDTWNEEATFEKHQSRVESIAVSPDGKWLASAGYDHNVGIWNLQTNQHVLLFHPEPYGQIMSVSFSYDSRFLAIGSRVGLIDIRSTIDWNPVVSLQTPDPIQRLEFSSDGLSLISGDPVGILRGWKLKKSQKSDEWKLLPWKAWSSQSNRIYATAFGGTTPDLWTGSKDGTLKLWDLSRVPAKLALSGDGKNINSVKMIGRSHALVACDEGLYRLDLDHPETWQPILEGQGQWQTVAVFANGKRYAASNDLGELFIWNSEKPSPLVVPFNDRRRGLVQAFSPNGRLIAFIQCPTPTQSGRVNVVDAIKGESLWSRDHIAPGNGMCFTPDNQYLIYGFGPRVCARHLENECDIEITNEHSQTVRWIDFSPDGQYFATSSADGTTNLWNTADFRQVHKFNTHANAIRGGRFGPSGQTLATIDAKGILKLFHVEAGQELLQLDLQKSDVGGLELTGDGRSLVTYCKERDRIFIIPYRWGE